MENLNEEWTFERDCFDYVHLRYLFGSVKDWNAMMRKSFDVCKPGGWVESYEASCIMLSDDGSVQPGSAMGEWCKFFISGSKKTGNSMTVIEEDLQIKAMEAAGFVDIQTKDLKVR